MNESNEDLDSDDDEIDEEANNMEDLGARLTGIDLDDSEEVWKHLTADERKEFEAFLLSGDVAQFMTMWTPWWEFKSTGVLSEEDWTKCKSNCPKIGDIHKFNEISVSKTKIL